MERLSDVTDLIEKLQLILEHSHNGYTFRYRCKGLQIIIEKMPNGSIEACYGDDRDGRVVVDVTREPFDKIIKWV